MICVLCVSGNLLYDVCLFFLQKAYPGTYSFSSIVISGSNIAFFVESSFL